MTSSIQEKLQKIDYEFIQFVKDCKRFKTENDRELVSKAYQFAKKAHYGSVRYSGQPYIRHSFEVAIIAVKEMGLDVKSAVVALLHDVPVKTEYSLSDINRNFGEKIADMVEKMLTIKNSEFFENDAQASLLRQILLSISDDIRVIFIKLADRLDNIRTINFLAKERRIKSVNETLNIYSPIAHRLGLYEIKSEMEDLCLKATNPTVYSKIKKKLKSTEEERCLFIDYFAAPIKQRLVEHNIKFHIKSRSKSIYSIWKKMQKQGVPFEKVYDLFAIRIIFTPKNDVNENFEAMYISSLITDLYHNKPDRTRNWLEKGKDTGYRALHLTVMSNQGKWVEVQIRSEAMNEAAEYGLAAHWKYKGINNKKSELDSKIKEILAHLSDSENESMDFLDNININLFNAEIFIFSVSGTVTTLPKGATALDFAFALDANNALKALAAKVNGRPVKLSHVLNSGDQVEIISSEKANPNDEWFKFVISDIALKALKNYFNEQRRNEIELGKSIIDKIFNKLPSASFLPNRYRKLANIFGLAQRELLFLQAGQGKKTKEQIVEAVRTNFLETLSKFWHIKVGSKLYAHDCDNQKGFILANCCNPEPGESIISIKNDASKLIIHRAKCPSALLLAKSENDFQIAQWSEQQISSVVKIIEIDGIDGIGVVTKISAVISEDLSVNMKSINFDTNNGKFFGILRIYLQQEEQLGSIIKRLLKIKNVIAVNSSNA